VNIDGGRGVGLPLVLEKIKEINGKIRVANHLGKGFSLKIVCQNVSAKTQLKLANS
jgi:sensor histidine kinase regulating citrate/malate metabolism